MELPWVHLKKFTVSDATPRQTASPPAHRTIHTSIWCAGWRGRAWEGAVNYINGPWSKNGVNGHIGRHAENYGGNGGMLFMDKDHSLTTGSFTAFAVVCLNDQTQPGRGQFTVLRGCHHAMEAFYQMQQALGGIVGPEGPGCASSLARSFVRPAGMPALSRP
jgi:hypothetical protein